MWEKYKNLGRDSGINKFRINQDSIDIEFSSGKRLKYPVSLIGSAHFIALVKLANQGEGLLSYIMTHPDVKKGFRELT
jgi:hypothetical protein